MAPKRSRGRGAGQGASRRRGEASRSRRRTAPPPVAAPDESQTRVAPDLSDTPTRARVGAPIRFDDERKVTFLAALEAHGMVTTAARAAAITTETVYQHRKADEAFAQAWAEAYAAYCDRLEMEAYRRAVDGVDEPVYQQGALVGVVRKYSDALLTLKLKRHRPEQYRERVQVNADVTARRVTAMVPSSMSEEAWTAWSTAAKEPSEP
jgi:hypothetical protein